MAAPTLLTPGGTVTLNVTQSQSVSFWPTDSSGIVIRTATPTNTGIANVRQYGPGMFRHNSGAFIGTLKLDVSGGNVYYVVSGLDP